MKNYNELVYEIGAMATKDCSKDDGIYGRMAGPTIDRLLARVVPERQPTGGIDGEQLLTQLLAVLVSTGVITLDDVAAEIQAQPPQLLWEFQPKPKSLAQKILRAINP